MHRVLLADPHIGSYAAFLVFALFAGYLITRWRAVRLGIKGSHVDNLMLLIAVLSLFGARFFSWLFYFPAGSPLWPALISGKAGMVFYGGLIFGIASVLLYARVAKLALGNLLDACAPGVALGLALGRVGCYMAGCCWGDLCVAPEQVAKLPNSEITWQVRSVPVLSGGSFPLSVTFPPPAGAYRQHQKLGIISPHASRSLPVHPVQLYEAALALALCAWLHFRFRQRSWCGEIAAYLALGYAAIRFATEFLRADNLPAYLGLTLSQVISILIAAVTVACLAWRRLQPFTAMPRPISVEAGP
jgi:phosphatidylglycerol:prolipoprotein diacylglycerol transferase